MGPGRAVITFGMREYVCQRRGQGVGTPQRVTALKQQFERVGELRYLTETTVFYTEDLAHGWSEGV